MGNYWGNLWWSSIRSHDQPNKLAAIREQGGFGMQLRENNPLANTKMGKKNPFHSVMSQNIILDKVAKLSGKMRLMLLVLSLLLVLLATVCLRQENSVLSKLSIILYMVGGCSAWYTVLASVVRSSVRYIIANIVTVVSVIGMITGVIHNPMQNNKTVLYSEISPNGSFVATADSSGKTDDGKFTGIVYVSNTMPMNGRKANYVSYELYNASKIEKIDMHWESNVVIVINDERIIVDWLYTGWWE